MITTTVTKRLQVAVPAAIRRRYTIRPGDVLAWIDDGETIKIVPIPKDPIRALRGCAKGEGLGQRLLETREVERERERR
ncbi:MAG: AbrB/MazE/SpoVT family DNA-binding domain-containing protein [Thermoflexales bacterium]|nr:AbrB/MazE/SpoVT family DNA-binding domain-containing protein [Thermoflexales bacterium]